LARFCPILVELVASIKDPVSKYARPRTAPNTVQKTVLEAVVLECEKRMPTPKKVCSDRRWENQPAELSIQM
jgi:hypothetical protein